MRMRTLVVSLACAALVAPSIAAGKGATRATVEGTGLDEGGITFASGTEGDPPSGSALDQLIQDTGFYPSAMGQDPSPLEPSRPAGDLGPRYTVTYTLPGPNMSRSEVKQDLYPYAEGGPVAFVAPGQPIFDTQTKGGWFRALPGLHELLVDHGLPANAPVAAADDGFEIPWSATAVTALVVAVLGGLALVAYRRRPRAVATP
jgi:hypothetical protein